MPLDGKPGSAATSIATWLATWFHVGHLPKAPGTFGSIAALPFAWILMTSGGPWLLLLATIFVFILGLWAAKRYMAEVGEHDPGAIVIDEVAGQWLTLLAAPLTPFAYLLGLAAFRFFDIVKPWPIGWLDRHASGAFGVMIDDIAAAFYAGIVVFLAVGLLNL